MLTIDLILVVLIILLLLLLSMVWPPDSPWSPWWRTNDKAIRQAFKLADLSSKDLVYDLGCGDGKTLAIAAKEFNARAIGIEIDPLRFWIAKFLILFSGLNHKVQIRRENFLKSDFSDASVVFVYLVPKALQRLVPQFKKLKKGTRIVSINYEVPLKEIKSSDHEGKFKIRLYKTP